jgi:hypothetical protein
MKYFLPFIKILMIFNVFILPSCKTNKAAFDPTTTKKDFITFGNGGGITGQVKKYFFTYEGEIYIHETDSVMLITTIPSKTSTQIFGSYLKLGLDKNILNEPGNRYYFLEMKSKDVNHALKWGRNELYNPNIEKYYNVLMNLVKQ